MQCADCSQNNSGFGGLLDSDNIKKSKSLKKKRMCMHCRVLSAVATSCLQSRERTSLPVWTSRARAQDNSEQWKCFELIKFSATLSSFSWWEWMGRARQGSNSWKFRMQFLSACCCCVFSFFLPVAWNLNDNGRGTSTAQSSRSLRADKV